MTCFSLNVGFLSLPILLWVSGNNKYISRNRQEGSQILLRGGGPKLVNREAKQNFAPFAQKLHPPYKNPVTSPVNEEIEVTKMLLYQRIFQRLFEIRLGLLILVSLCRFCFYLQGREKIKYQTTIIYSYSLPHSSIWYIIYLACLYK